MADYTWNIGVYQGDSAGSDYKWNIGVDQKDKEEAPPEEGNAVFFGCNF